jgi:hypothetical protein
MPSPPRGPVLRLQNASPGLKALWKLEAEKKLVEA